MRCFLQLQKINLVIDNIKVKRGEHQCPHLFLNLR